MSIQADLDRLYMLSAKRLAEKGLFTVTRHNPRVGCLLVKDGTVMGRGWHRLDGGDHAEVEALKDAGNSARGSTAYVTLEPCCWEGRTPACTNALVEQGVSTVVLGLRDPHPKVNGRGAEALRNCGIEVRELPLPELESLNPGQKKRVTENLPWVRIKSAISLDGRTAMGDGESKWITGESARDDVQFWRARSGAIVTGIGTVLADDPRLTVRGSNYPNSTPLRIVLDTHARIPRDARMFEEDGEVVVVCGANANVDGLNEVATVWRQSEELIVIRNVLERLASEGVNEVLVEAGARLNGSFLADGLWDELLLYVAPKILGDDARPFSQYQISRMADAVGARVESVVQLDHDTRLNLARL